MTQRELAARMDRPPQAINEIINAKKAITPETAIGLENVLGVSATFWLNLEASYQLTVARNRERETLALLKEVLHEYPIAEMIKRGWIQAGRDAASRLKALSGFLGLANPAPQNYGEIVGFRMTQAGQQSFLPGSLAAWLRRGELVAEEIGATTYDRETFLAALPQIRAMTESSPEEFLPKMKMLCSDAGVAFCLVQELPRSGANGVTRWIGDDRPLIQLSIRGKWADIFWFTFFHEACHVLNHMGKSRVIIQGAAADPDMVGIEEEANRFAGDFLIPPHDWTRFLATKNFGRTAIVDFAKSIDIAPFIVLGRLNKEKLVPYNRLSDLKKRYQWTAA